MFLESVSTSLKTVYGYYFITLPLKKKYRLFPNNCCVAEHGTQNLRRKFAKDKKFYTEYKTFMAFLLDKSFAVRLTPAKKQRLAKKDLVHTTPRCLPPKKEETEIGV